ncbi:MAG: 3-deoxy-manno-octulosonate cytidylyltransferase [Rickettsiales bacterium]|nr:3-deoxy-manno-octulosonate cytidylyltransferase [Rickettsiales bacterium]
MNQKILIIIPARLASTRLPNKPLADIGGKPMIARVYERAIASKVGDVLIACDGEEIANIARNIGANFVITDPNLPSGTDRIYNAYKVFIEKNNLHNQYQVIINLQGDLPIIESQSIVDVANLALNSSCDIATIASRINNYEEVINPNIVKIAIANLEHNIGEALYFSRAPIPYQQSKIINFGDYFHHIGIYGYKITALENFIKLPPSKLEKRESLEQLRALENKMSIMVKIVDSHPLSVDTEDDLLKARALCIDKR